MQVRLMDGETEIGRCTALLTAMGSGSPADPFSKVFPKDAGPETGSPPPAPVQKWSRYFQNVPVRLIEGALEKPGPAAAWMRLDAPMVQGETNTPLLQAVLSPAASHRLSTCASGATLTPTRRMISNQGASQ